MSRYLLGIDVGTTGTKAMLFSEDGKIEGQAYRSYPMHTPNIGWSEQNPLDWWKAVVETVREVCSQPGVGEAVLGISLSTQGGTTVVVDGDFQASRPAMVWNDKRCQAENQEYLDEVGFARSMYEKTGWFLGFGLNALHIRWMKKNEPEAFGKTKMFLSVPDYISYKMTGKAVIDLSNAGINQLGNISQGKYDKDILRFIGISEDQLPRICKSGEVIGHLTQEAATELGLTTNAVLSAGAHDQYAAALGAGACKAGDIFVGSGTCWVITCIGDELDFDSGLSQSVAAVPGKYGSLCSLSSGGVCLEWLRRNVMLGEDEKQISYATIDKETANRKAAEEKLFFYPFAGKATSDQRLKRGSFVGLDLSHDRYHMARAVMEGVAFQIVWMMESFKVKPSQDGLILSGGASKSQVWAQILADVANLPVRIPAVADLTCVGAAILAGVGCGIYQDAQEGYRKLAVGDRVVYPNAERALMYADRMQEYRKLAIALGEIHY